MKSMQQQTTAKGSFARIYACTSKLSLKNKIADTTMNMVMVDIIAMHLHSFHATDQHCFGGSLLDYLFATAH